MSKSLRPEWDRLLMACQKGQADLVKTLISKEGVDANHANAIGQSALHIACWWCHVDCVEYLLEHSANVHATNTLTGATPLHCCMQSPKAAQCKSERLQCIRLLLEHSADPHKTDFLQKQPMDYLESDGSDRQEIVDLVIKKEEEPPIYALLKEKNLEQIQLLLKEDPSQIRGVHSKDKNSTATSATKTNAHNPQRILDWSKMDKSKKQSLERIPPLVQVVEEWSEFDDGDDADQGSGRLLLREYYPQVFHCLLQAGANVHSTNQDDRTSLDLLCTAIARRYKEKFHASNNNDLLNEDILLSSWRRAVTELLSYSQQPQPQQEQSYCRQIWMDIARRNYLTLAEWWRDWQLSPIGIANRQNMTPLQFAARSGHIEMVAFLLKHYYPITMNEKQQDKKDYVGSVRHQDQRGQTALDAARANQHEAVVELLQRHTTAATGL